MQGAEGATQGSWCPQLFFSPTESCRHQRGSFGSERGPPLQSLHPDGIGREKRKTGESGGKSPPLFFPLSRNLHVLCILTEYFLTHSEDLGSALTVGTGHSQASVLVLRLFPPFGLHFHSPCPPPPPTLSGSSQLTSSRKASLIAPPGNDLCPQTPLAL